MNSPAKYRKRPVVIEAIQWTGDNFFGVFDFLNGDFRKSLDSTVLVIPTLEGDLVANIGDWIIKGIRGEFYPCKPEIFEATYEVVA